MLDFFTGDFAISICRKKPILLNPFLFRKPTQNARFLYRVFYHLLESIGKCWISLQEILPPASVAKNQSCSIHFFADALPVRIRRKMLNFFTGDFGISICRKKPILLNPFLCREPTQNARFLYRMFYHYNPSENVGFLYRRFCDQHLSQKTNLAQSISSPKPTQKAGFLYSMFYH